MHRRLIHAHPSRVIEACRRVSILFPQSEIEPFYCKAYYCTKSTEIIGHDAPLPQEPGVPYLPSGRAAQYLHNLVHHGHAPRLKRSRHAGLSLPPLEQSLHIFNKWHFRP